MGPRSHRVVLALLVVGLLASCGGGETSQRAGSAERDDLESIEYEIARDPDVPNLPFDDNPDPSQCGIPVPWGDANSTAWLTGEWGDELIQPDVLLYESHLRTSVTGMAKHGSEVRIVLLQENPVLDYYFVKVVGDTVAQGWVPEPFLSFDPVS